MTLKQWLSSMALPYRESVAAEITALTDAYYRDQQAKAADAFTRAFLKLRPELPIIDERGVIEYRDGRKGTYALNEDIQVAVQPLLNKHGFDLTFEESYPEIATIAIDGILMHKRGHTRRTRFESGADMTGGKNVAQGRASVISFGHRYCTISLLNLVTRGNDDDAQSAGFKFGFDPAQLHAEAKPIFKTLIGAALDDTLDECWKALDTSERASVGFECLQYVKQVAGYVR